MLHKIHVSMNIDPVNRTSLDISIFRMYQETFKNKCFIYRYTIILGTKPICSYRNVNMHINKIALNYALGFCDRQSMKIR